jgi:hypothetical protein
MRARTTANALRTLAKWCVSLILYVFPRICSPIHCPIDLSSYGRQKGIWSSAGSFVRFLTPDPSAAIK